MYAGGGFYVGDDWDRAIAEAHHTMDQVEDMVYTVARAGEMVGDILHVGNKVGGYIKREAQRGMGKAPSGPRRSPSGRARGGRF